MLNAATQTTTAGGFLLVLAIMTPVAGILLSLLLGGRWVERVALILLPAGFGISAAVLALVWQGGHSLVYVVGGAHGSDAPR